MDHNLPVVTKKLKTIIHAILYMLKKGISKSKIMLELNMVLKRGKIAGKTMIGNLMFHHHNDTSIPREYEFSCSNSPAYFPFHLNKHNHHHTKSDQIVCAQLPPSLALEENDIATLNGVNNILENLNMASPMILCSRRGNTVRQVRVTDSPFPFQDATENGTTSQVDAAAEEFIQKFYRQLKRQIKSPGHGH